MGVILSKNKKERQRFQVIGCFSRGNWLTVLSSRFLLPSVSPYSQVGPDFLSMRRVFVSYSQPIRFVRFDGKSVNRRHPVLDQSLVAAPQERGLWRWEWSTSKSKSTYACLEWIIALFLVPFFLDLANKNMEDDAYTNAAYSSALPLKFDTPLYLFRANPCKWMRT